MAGRFETSAGLLQVRSEYIRSPVLPLAEVLAGLLLALLLLDWVALG